MTAHEQHLEGQLRFVNSRVITNSEEISFYQGNSRERVTLYSTFDQLVRDGRGERGEFCKLFFCLFVLFRLGIYGVSFCFGSRWGSSIPWSPNVSTESSLP